MSEWTRFAELQALVTSLHTSVSGPQLKTLELRLIKHRPNLRRFLHNEAKDAAKRDQIKTGAIKRPDGSTENANAAFVAAVIALSDTLNISETDAVSLLRHALKQAPLLGRDALETAVHEYSRERLALVECLSLMISGAVDQSVPAEARRVFQHHMQELFSVTSASEKSFPIKVADAIASLGTHIDVLRSDTCADGYVTGSKLKGEGVTEALISLTVDGAAKLRLTLSGLLLSIAQFVKLSFADAVYFANLAQSSNTADPIWVPMGMVVIAGLQGLPTDSELTQEQLSHVKTLNTLVFGTSSKWGLKGLQDTIAIQFALFLKQARTTTPQLEQSLGYHENIETKMSLVLSNTPPFQFMKDYLVSWATLDSAAPQQVVDVDAETEIREHILSIFHKLATGFFSLLGRCVRTLKNEAEDLEVTSSLNGTAQQGLVNSGLRQLLEFVQLLYRDRPDEGHIFWTDPDLFKFLRYMLDVRAATIMTAYLDALASLATGPKSAACAGEFFSTEHSKLSWEALFRSLDLTAKHLAAHPEGEMQVGEVLLQRAFLRLLTQVVKFSDVARMSLYSSAHLQVINTLFNLLTRRISVDLKAALFSAIAAFALPVEKGSVSDIALMIWRHLEQAEIVPRPAYVSGFHYGTFPSHVVSTRPEGIRYDMEQVEAQNQLYPETKAFLVLLNTLLVAIKPNQLTGAVDGFSTRLSAPGGINHYVHFVVEEVFLKIHNRAFISGDEKWRMIEYSMNLFDQCLKSFEFMYASGGSLDNPAYAQLRADAIATVQNPEVADTIMISAHPGFSLMLRILSGGPFLKKLFELASVDVQDINRFGRKCPAFTSSVKLALRVLLRTFSVQKFISDLIATDAGQYLKNSPTVASVDQLLAFYKDTVVRIALFVNCQVDDEVCLLSVNLLTAISQSAIFNVVDTAPGKYGKINRLVTLLDSSDFSHQIVSGFVNRLEMEEPTDLLDVNEQLGTDSRLAGLKLDAWKDPDLAIVLFGSVPASYTAKENAGLTNLIRLAILDLLVENLLTNRAFPTVSHFLLGYNIKKTPVVEIVEVNSQRGRRCCLHTVLDLLRVGTLGAGGRSGMGDTDLDLDVEVPLFYSHPKLSERCFRLIYELCSDETTSSNTMRFLRTTENFFYRQLEAMPVDFVVPQASRLGEPNSVVSSTQLHQRSWLMQLIALELHVTTLIGQRSHAQKLLDLLFISPVSDMEKANPFALSSNRFEQPLTKMLEILNSLDFSGDQQSVSRANVTYFSDLDISNFVQFDEYNYCMYDIRAVHSFLLTKQRQLEKQGNATGVYDRARVKAEIGGILQELLDRNSRTENLGARIHCIYAWSLIMRTAFGQSFDLLPADSREEKSYELLKNIFPKFNASNASNDICEYMANVILELLHRLRDDRAYQAMLQTSGPSRGEEVPKLKSTVDALQQNILKGLLDGILRAESSPSLRENLYSALLHYLGFTNPEDGELELEAGKALTPYNASLVYGNLSVIASAGWDKLLETVCRDAAAADRVLKTAALSLLEALCQLAGYQTGAAGAAVGAEKGNQVVSFMVKRNFLSGFVGSLVKQEDVAIQALMQSNPAPENWPFLYIFEAKMSLLLRVAQQRDGMEKLVEAGLLDALVNLKLIDERPDSDADPMDSDRQGLEATEIYYMTATPVFELLWSVVSSGYENAPLLARVSQFLYTHQETFIAILKNKNALTSNGSAAAMQELELATAFIAYLGSNRELLEFGIRGSGYTSFHNITVSLLMHYASAEVGHGVGREVGLVQERHVQVVLRNLLSYAEIVSSGEYATGPSDVTVSLVFSMDLTQKQDKSRISAQTILKSLARSVDQYQRATDEHRSLSHKAADIQRLGVDEINDIAKRAGVSLIDEFSTLQRQQVALQELKKEGLKRGDDIAVLLQIIDNLLLLLWRYFEFCVGTDSSAQLEASNTRFMRAGAAAALAVTSGDAPSHLASAASAEDKDVAKLRQELSGALDKVARLDLVSFCGWALCLIEINFHFLTEWARGGTCRVYSDA
ncbi:nucleoporin Nup186/Nup192/Nup205 [Chytriomyces sp. MP71]|nr:nucleoporin Nup186/Nup192/Nup205 [Chytriomyces sp. MP71]